MKRFLMSVVLSVTFLTSLSPAREAGRGNSRGERSSAYHERHGVRFSGGYFYAGRGHRHWKSCYFDKRCGCYLYLCPSVQAYYYWCERDVRFYPVSYCPYGTYNFGAGRVCSTCPVVAPTNPPPITFGGNPPRGGTGSTSPTPPPKITHGPNPPRGPQAPPPPKVQPIPVTVSGTSPIFGNQTGGANQPPAPPKVRPIPVSVSGISPIFGNQTGGTNPPPKVQPIPVTVSGTSPVFGNQMGATNRLPGRAPGTRVPTGNGPRRPQSTSARRR